jgi:hypothetical protein
LSYAELAAPPKEPIEIALRAFGGSPQKRVDQLQVILTLLIEAWVPLPGQPTPQLLELIEDDWNRLPKDVTSGQPGPREWFESSLKERRAAYEQWQLRR